MTAEYTNYKIIRQWTDGKGHRWFTVRWSNGQTTTHELTA